MSTVRYALKIMDGDIIKNVELTDLTYDRRYITERTLVDTDGSVAIDMSSLNTISLVYIETSGAVVFTLSDSSTITVDGSFFATAGVEFTAMETAETDNVTVKLYAYGSSS